MNEREPSTSQEAVKNTGERSFVLPLVIAVVSVIVFLDASIFLRSWAMASPLNHTIDHVLIFLSGSAFGGALFSMLKSRNT